VNSDERWFPSHLRKLDAAECLELLAAYQVGRVACCDDLGSVVVPVNYALDHGAS
jgi:nitroimidazol reductase NimA-like FMN-containing flavoprotein (pyridoxamine 5'-phosphate oxidase superfamily)